MYFVAIPDSFETSHVLFDISLSLENERMNVNTPVRLDNYIDVTRLFCSNHHNFLLLLDGIPDKTLENF